MSFPILTLLSLLAAQHAPNTRLHVDPLLVAEADAIWKVIAADENPVWPGWNAKDTPLLLYLPGVQDVLINHPHPPDGFLPYAGAVKFSGGAIFVRDGATTIEWDGQNTSRDIAGVRTLVLADTLSNLKQDLRGWFEDPREPERKLADLGYETALLRDPYEQMAMIAHEAFHVFQDRSAPDKGANELDVRLYPCLSVKNNVEWALEGDALGDALRAKDSVARRRAAVRWLALRLDRRSALRAEAVNYEDGNEFSEGLAMYVEWRLAHVLEGREAPERLWFAQGFHGFGDLSAMRASRVDEVIANLHGDVNVNNDAYGTASLRRRLYFSGMAIGALLDELGADWKTTVFAADATLTELARAAIGATESELAVALAEVRALPEWKSWTEKKAALEAAGRADTQALLARIGGPEHTPLEIDASELGSLPIGLSFTGYGVRALDDDRTIYTLVPIEADFGSERDSFAETIPTPTLEDRAKHLYRLQLDARVDARRLAECLGRPPAESWKVDDLDVTLPGVRLRARRAEIEFRDDTVRVRMRRPQ